MAKFAKIGYGSQGQGLGKTQDGYTYVVNDNVRTKDILQVISTSSAGKKFPTTGMALHTFKQNSVKGMEAKQEVESKNKEITESYTGKELGIERAGKTRQEYQQQTRAGNIQAYLQKNPQAELTPNATETFESYSQKFIKGEQR